MAQHITRMSLVLTAFVAATGAPGEVRFPNCSTTYVNGKPLIVCNQAKPLSSDDEAWQKRLEQGSVLLNRRSYDGIQASPPMDAQSFGGSKHMFRHSHSGGGGGGGGTQSRSDNRLVPIRAFITPAEEPPKDVAAYGIVAFTSRPLDREAARDAAFCEAFKSTLLTVGEAGPVPPEDQMVTFWPVRQKPSAVTDPACDVMITQYDLKAGLDAINDADHGRKSLAQKRGPFLIAWSPSESRRLPDPVILVVDMSGLDSPESFQDTLKAWRQKIVDDPRFWRGGFNMETVRLEIRDAIDKYGAVLLPFLGQKDEKRD